MAANHESNHESNSGNIIERYQDGRIIPCNYLSPYAPYQWVKKGLYDFLQAPTLSLYFGLFFVITLTAVLLLAYLADSVLPTFLVIPLMVLIAPQIVFCLYDISRQIQRATPPSLIHALKSLRKNQSQQWGFAFVLFFLSLFWTRVASLLYIFYPQHSTPNALEAFPFILIGSTVGSLFLVLLFLISAFTLPLLIERRIDVVSAMLTSANAVITNKVAMLHWAALIGIAVSLGALAGLICLAVTIPIIGFSAWHGYQETILVPRSPRSAASLDERFIP